MPPAQWVVVIILSDWFLRFPMIMTIIPKKSMTLDMKGWLRFGWYSLIRAKSGDLHHRRLLFPAYCGILVALHGEVHQPVADQRITNTIFSAFTQSPNSTRDEMKRVERWLDSVFVQIPPQFSGESRQRVRPRALGFHRDRNKWL